MKKLLFLFTVMAVSSCEKKPIAFKGFEEFTIGTDFKTLPKSKYFLMTMPEEYNAGEFQLSDKIGFVSDLNVTTQKGKICEVKFKSNEKTNTEELKKLYSDLIEVKINNKFKMKHVDMKYYTTPNKKILLFVFKTPSISFKTKTPIYSYQYVDSDYAEKEAKKQWERFSGHKQKKTNN